MKMLNKNNIDHINFPNNMKKGWNYDAIFGHNVNQKTSSSYESFPKLSVEFFSYGHGVDVHRRSYEP